MLKTVRWKIGLLMFAGILVNYLDRVNISQSIVVITKSFSLTELQKGWVLSAFAIGYVAMMMVSGYIVFKLGSRIALTASMLLLALATIGCGLSFSFASLLFFRLLIGIFESPIYPAFATISGIWFPKNERVKAIGLFDIGSYTGIAFATLVIGLIIAYFNWRYSFIFSGVVTLIWAGTWFFYYRDNPVKHSGISSAELQTIGTGTVKHEAPKVKWLRYLTNRKVIGISIGFFCFNYLKSFYITWLPTYMIETKGIKMLSFGLIGSLPMLFAIAAEITMAYMVDKLIAKGYSASVIKKLPICLGMIFSTVIVFSLFTANTVTIIILLTLSYMFLTSASVAIWSIPSELAASQNEVSIIGSIQNTFSNISGIIAPVVTGYFYGLHHTFFIPFIISIAVSIIGAASYWKLAGKLKYITVSS